MKYECKYCKYETHDTSNYKHHLKSKKHQKNSEINSTIMENLDLLHKKDLLKKDTVDVLINTVNERKKGIIELEKKIELINNLYKKDTNNNLIIQTNNNTNKDIICNSEDNNEENDSNDSNNLFECKHCGIKLKHKSSKSRHEKQCKNTEPKNKGFKEEIKQEIEEIKDTVLDNSIGIQILAKGAKKFAQSTISTVSFIMKYLNDAPVIEKDVDYLKLLQFDSQAIFKDDNKIVEDLISFKRHGTLVKYLGDIIISMYKKKDPSKQSIWNSDITRKNYLLRDLVNKKPLWITDKAGILTSDIVIHPLLMTIRELMVDYLKTPYIKPENKTLTNENEKRYFNNDTIMDIILEIDDNKLHDEISNYLCPYFHFDKNIYIEQMDEIIKSKVIKDKKSDKVKKEKTIKQKSKKIDKN